jgi:triacylglycerol esterase/lipase EstA (alpha/beta hydrolase family)
MTKTQMRDLVVILPGIAGSVLQKDGEDIWNFSGQSVWQLIQTFGNSLNQLKLQENRGAEDFDDGVKATSLVRGAHIIPGLEKILSGYHYTSQLITNNFEVVVGNIFEDKPANFYEFSYDWRLDNRINAQKLKTFVDRQLPIWRESKNLKDAKVILLAHSMGGLISRYYLEVLEGWPDCKALFTFGTPYRGSINAIDFLANDHRLLKVADLNNVLRSFPSVYQLLPRQPVLKIGDGYQSIAQASIPLPNINPNMALDAWNFHSEIESAVNRHLDDAKYLRSYKINPIVGLKQTTKQSALLMDGKITFSETELPQGIDPIYGDGDGTVPYWSAIPHELSYEYRETYVSEKHGAIQSNAEVLRQVHDRIRGMQAQGLGNIRGPEVTPDIAEKAAISFSVDDLYLAGEIIVIRAQLKATQQDFGGIKAEIRSLTDESLLLLLQLKLSDDNWIVETDSLAPGVYQVTVRTNQTPMGFPTPVRDVFEVI